MELFCLENKGYTMVCDECYEPSKYILDLENFKLIGECINNHHINLDISQYYKYDYDNESTDLKIIKNNFRLNQAYISINHCYKCYLEIDDDLDGFICKECQKIFCKNCINEHSQENNHYNKIKYININKLCRVHNKKHLFFCNDCKINLCDDCKNSHISHCIKLYSNIIITKKEYELKSSCLNNYKKKINKIMDEITKLKKEINKRYDNLYNYFQFLSSICKFLKNFNHSFFNYYNHENYKYYFNNLEYAANSKIEYYSDYLLFGKNLKTVDLSSLKSVTPIRLENNIMQYKLIKSSNYSNNLKPKFKKELPDINNNLNLIKCFKNLKYYKDNIFILYEINYFYNFSLYVYKGYYFHHILTYNFELKGNSLCILNIGKYNNYFFITGRLKVKVLKYNSLDKKIYFIDEIENNSDFYGIINNKNGDIITADKNRNLIVWKKNKKNLYEKKIFLNAEHCHLKNINDYIFASYDLDGVCLFDSEKFKPIKSFHFKEYINDLEIICDNLLLIKSLCNDFFYIIDLKYFEIIQSIHNGTYQLDYIKINEKYFLEVKNEYIISKKYFSFHSGSFIEEKINPIYKGKGEVIRYENDYIIILDINNLKILKI